MICCRFLILSLCVAPAIRGPEKAIVEAIRAGKTIAGADAKFAAAIRKIDELRGQFEFDVAGRLVGVDLAGDRTGR